MSTLSTEHQEALKQQLNNTDHATLCKQTGIDGLDDLFALATGAEGSEREVATVQNYLDSQPA